MAPSIEKVFVMDRTGAVNITSNKDIPLEKEMTATDATCPAEVLDAEDPLFMLYTSGSTGEPKGLLKVMTVRELSSRSCSLNC